MPLKSSAKHYILIGFVLIFFVFIQYFGWLKAANKVILTLLKPLLIKTNELKNNDASPLNDLSSDKQNSGSELLKAKIKILTSENNQLRQLLNFEKKSKESLVIANVISREINNLGQLVVIDRGSESGVKLSSAVVTNGNVLVGKIIKVDNNFSIVRLINDTQSKVAVTILGQNQTVGVLEGGFGLSLQIKFIPRNEVVLVGDQVVTSGQESGVPHGLFLGIISAIQNEAYQPFQQAILTPAANLSKILIVGVLVSS